MDTPSLRLETETGGRVLVNRDSWRSTRSCPVRLDDKAALTVEGSLGGTGWIALSPVELRKVASTLSAHADALEEESKVGVEAEKWHTMRLVKYDSQPVPYYRGHCTKCDKYTSAYWDPADVALRHPAEEYYGL